MFRKAENVEVWNELNAPARKTKFLIRNMVLDTSVVLMRGTIFCPISRDHNFSNALIIEVPVNHVLSNAVFS